MGATDGREPETVDLPSQRAGGQYFFDPGVDRLIAVVLNLAAEVWTQREQLRLHDVLTADGDPGEADLKVFIDRIFEPLRER